MGVMNGVMSGTHEVFQKISQAQQCTVADGATIPSGVQVHDNTARVVSASQSQVSPTPAHIFEVHIKNFSFSGGLVSENLQFY